MNTKYPFVVENYGTPVSEHGGIKFDLDYSQTVAQNFYPENVYYNPAHGNTQYTTFEGATESGINELPAAEYQHAQFTNDNVTDIQGNIKIENWEQVGVPSCPSMPYTQQHTQNDPRVDMPCPKLEELHIDNEVVKCSSTPRSKQIPAVTKTPIKLPREKERNRLPAKRQPQRKSQIPAGDDEKAHSDQFSQWYQMMSQYYSQFYSGYHGTQPYRSIKPGPNGQVEVKKSPGSQPANKTQTSRIDYHNQVPPHITSFLPPPMPQQIPPTAVTSQFDYANYYYQYYYGAAAAAAAAHMWPGSYPFQGLVNSGRQTPRLYHNPHIRAWLSNPGFLLQVLPSRPLDGELARIELLDISQIANDAVAEATKKTAENDMKPRGYSHYLDAQRDLEVDPNRDGCSSNVSGVDSPGGLSSLQCPTGDESVEDAGTRMCAVIALTWDRTDHVFFPGPLIRSETLKADVLAFLRDKLAEIQDRMPIDWESAGLLMSYLELMVKSNGVVQSSDLVNLLLQGHEPQTYQFRTKSTVAFTSQPSTGTLPYPSTLAQQSGSYLTDSLSSLHSSQLLSGQQSPQPPYGGGGMMLPASFDVGQAPHLRAASETGGYGSSQAILRRAAATVVVPRTPNTSGSEDRHVDRFRELLMHGLSMKALEHACRYQLWGHAFTLAHRIGQPTLERVMEWFVTRAVAPNDPILTLYQLTAGEIPQIVTDAAYGKGSDNGDWRPHLAMILSGESSQPELSISSLQRLGDSLLSRRLVYAAHLCYLLMGPQYEQIDGDRGHVVYKLPEKIWLLGMASPSLQPKQQPDVSDIQVPQKPPTVLTAPTEAIQLTEIYEYAMQLANRNYRLCQLLPFRLVYACRLIDAGLLDKAYRYLAAIGNTILTECASDTNFINPVMYSLMSNCLRLAEPLLNHPDLGSFDMHFSGTSHFRLDRRTSAAHIRRSGGFLPTGNDNWIANLRHLHDEAHKKFHYHRNQNLTTLTALKKASDVPVSVPELINRYDNHAQQPPVKQPQQHQVHGHTQQRTGPYIDAGDDKILPVGHQGFVNSTSSVRPEYPGYAQLQQTKLQGTEHSWQNPGIHQPAQLHTSQPMLTNIARDRIEDCPATPVNIKPSASPFAVDFDLSRHQLSNNTPTECHQFASVSTPVAPNRSSAAPHSPTAASSSTISAQTENYSLLQHNDCAKLWSTPPPNDHLNAMTTSPCLPKSSDSFFTPMSVSQPCEQGPAVFDYFSGLPQQLGSRSRTTSGTSQSGTIIHGPDDEPRSRSNSGTSQSRRTSANYERPTFSSMQHQNTPQQSHATRQSNQHSTGHYPKPIQEAHTDLNLSGKDQPSEQSASTATDNGNQNQSKEGWLSGLFGRWKGNGTKNIHLPDDSKPSIVWDDELKRWIDVANPDASDPSPPPPPASFSGHPTGPQCTVDMGSFRGSARSRYVNVLGSQTSGSASSKLDTMLQPPLPPTALPSHGKLSENPTRGMH